MLYDSMHHVRPLAPDALLKTPGSKPLSINVLVALATGVDYK